MSITHKALKEFVGALYSSDFKDELPERSLLDEFSEEYILSHKKAKKREPTPEVLDLKEQYKKKFGRSPGGPKVNDPDWLKAKLDDSDSDSEPKVSKEVLDLKEQYKLKFGKSPGGPKVNDPEWLKSKLEDSDKKSSGKYSPEVQALKDEYKKLSGKSAKGPKASDPDWLQSKIDAMTPDDSDSEIDESDTESLISEESYQLQKAKQNQDIRVKSLEGDVDELKEEVDEMKKEYKHLEEMEEESVIMLQAFARGFLHRKHLKAKKSSLGSELPPPHPEGVEAKKRKDKKEKKKKKVKKEKKEKKKKKSSEKGMKPLELDLDSSDEEFDYEGVKYFRRIEDGVINVYNDDDMCVGKWCDDQKVLMFNSEEGWDDIHHELVNDLD